VEPATRLLPWFYKLSITVLMDFHHGRIKDDMERIVMQSTVSTKLLHVNAQFNYTIMAVLK
jgi:hypothetical protein